MVLCFLSLWSWKSHHLWCRFALCNLKPFLDLEIFPQISQEWKTLLLMWLDSMCVIMFARMPSFPHILHILNLSCFPEVSLFSLKPIIDLICSSNCRTSSLTRATGISEEGSSSILISIGVDLFLIDSLCCFLSAVIFCGGSSFWYLGRLLSTEPASPFSLNSSASARKASRFSWSMFVSPT